jgi:hypothetical protein
MTETAGVPALSAIVITSGDYSDIRKAIGHLRAQNVRAQIELVIVAPSRALLGRVDFDSELAGFCRWQIVELGSIPPCGAMIAAGVRASQAPAVVYVEEHSFPAPGWAEALIDAHREPWAAVGPAVSNANPATGTSWAMLFLEFGAWVPPALPEERRLLAAHQTSYKRAVLLECGAALDDLMEVEATLQSVLQVQGHRLFFEPAAQTAHTNISRVPDMMMATYQSYRVFAATRAAYGGWSRGRRLLYILGGPLLPPLRIYRTLREVRRAGRLGHLWAKISVPLLLASISASIGEVVGFSAGAGAAARKRVPFELKRLSYVSKTDQQEKTAVW